MKKWELAIHQESKRSDFQNFFAFDKWFRVMIRLGYRWSSSVRESWTFEN